MASRILSPKEELKAIVSQLKNLMVVDRDMGLEPPTFSPSTLSYLEPGLADPHSLNDLRDFIGDCKRCKLCRGRTNLVFGEGSPKARLVFVGEGPGREEDLAGRPFVGEAGRLLTRIIEKGMGLKREEVYICNVVKCRPPHNRDPDSDEIEACMPFLKQQLRIIGPEVICTLGRVPAQSLLGTEFKITQERGKWFAFLDIPLMPTYHPAYLLRNPSAKRQVWEDAQQIMGHLGLEVKRNE
ncbi:MAG: uracil-DNA glycosylase [Desulfobacteraceae bacterium]|jgi:DNA polymerase